MKRLCSIEGCGRKHYGIGLCHKHYCQRPEYNAKRREYRKKYRQRSYVRQKNLEYAHKRWKENPDYWKIRYQNKRMEIRAKQKAYDATPEAKALKRKATAKPERKAKKAEYMREYQAKPDVHARRMARSRAYRRTPEGLKQAQYYNERRRARLLGAKGSFTKEEWFKLRDEVNGICQICSKNVGAAKLSIDHIIPLSKGGSNEISNIRPICRNCNSAIGNRPYLYQIDENTGKRVKVYGY